MIAEFLELRALPVPAANAIKMPIDHSLHTVLVLTEAVSDTASQVKRMD